MKRKIKFKSKNAILSGLFEKPNIHNGFLIILLHGLTNSMEDCPLINETNTSLINQNFATLRFDYFGSGKSPGLFKDKTFSILHQNTVSSIEFAQDNLKFKTIGLWGRSLGAILASTVCDDQSINATVLISSTIHTEESFSGFFQKDQKYSLPLKGTGIIKGEPVLPYDFFKETKWIDNLQRIHLAKASNVLVVQGTKDNIITNLNWTREIFSSIKGNKKLEFIKGADHKYSGYENIAVKKGIDWFEKHI